MLAVRKRLLLVKRLAGNNKAEQVSLLPASVQPSTRRTVTP